jgi:hypothetical protein
MDETIQWFSLLPSTRVHCIGQIRDYPALASIIDRSIHLCRYSPTPCVLVLCAPSPKHSLSALSSLNLLPFPPFQNPFTPPTPFISVHTYSRAAAPQQHPPQPTLCQQYLNPKLPQLRQGRQRRRADDTSRSTYWLDGGDFVVSVGSPLPPPFFHLICLSFSLPQSLPSLSPFLPPFLTPFIPPPFSFPTPSTVWGAGGGGGRRGGGG